MPRTVSLAFLDRIYVSFVCPNLVMTLVGQQRAQMQVYKFQRMLNIRYKDAVVLSIKLPLTCCHLSAPPANLLLLNCRAHNRSAGVQGHRVL